MIDFCTPCPRCGCTSAILHESFTDEAYSIECMQCHAKTPDCDTELLARETWAQGIVAA